MPMFDEYKPLIEDARKRVYELAVKTPLELVPQFSEACENRVWLKRRSSAGIFLQNQGGL